MSALACQLPKAAGLLSCQYPSAQRHCGRAGIAVHLRKAVTDIGWAPPASQCTRRRTAASRPCGAGQVTLVRPIAQFPTGEVLERPIRQIVEVTSGTAATRCFSTGPLSSGDPRRPAVGSTMQMQFPVPLAPKTRERTAKSRISRIGNANNINARMLMQCFGKGEVVSSILTSSISNSMP